MKRLSFLILTLIFSLGLQSQQKNVSFRLKPITEKEYKKAYNNNYNAPFQTKISDNAKLELAFNSIAETYTEEEKELADRELTTPEKLTEFKAYYPKLQTYLFFIQNYHYENACFVSTLTNNLLSINRFRGSFGVMSKDGFWVGLERGDCDNYLQIELCEITNKYAISIINFDVKFLDINEDNDKIPSIFWAKKNTIYLSTIRYHNEEISSKPIYEYYSIEFEY
jgi:hypothetical protein